MFMLAVQVRRLWSGCRGPFRLTRTSGTPDSHEGPSERDTFVVFYSAFLVSAEVPRRWLCSASRVCRPNFAAPDFVRRTTVFGHIDGKIYFPTGVLFSIPPESLRPEVGTEVANAAVAATALKIPHAPPLLEAWARLVGRGLDVLDGRHRSLAGAGEAGEE